MTFPRALVLRALAAVGVAALVAWVIAPGPRDQGVAARESEVWAMPPAPARQPPAALIQSLAKSELWGKGTDSVASEALQDPPWRLMGIVKAGEERFVLLKIQGQPEQRLTTNDKLPGGSEIVEIGDDSLCIMINGQKRRLAIHKTGSQVL